MKSLLGQVASAMPSHIPSLTLSKQNCFVQLAQGFESAVGISNMVEFDPQKHLQNILMSAPCAKEMSDPTSAVDRKVFILLLRQEQKSDQLLC